LDLIVRIFRHERYHPCRSRLSLVVDGVNYQRVWVCIPAFWDAVIKRGFEQEKRLAALKTKRQKAVARESDKPMVHNNLKTSPMSLMRWLNLPGHSSAKSAEKTIEKLQALLLEAADMLGAS